MDGAASCGFELGKDLNVYHAAGDREFCVKGKLMEAEDKLNLRLRIGQHTGGSLVVYFDHCSQQGFKSNPFLPAAQAAII